MHGNKKYISDSLTETEIKNLYNLMINAYAQTESEIWSENYKRLSLEEYEQVLQNGDVYIALEDNLIVGSISVYHVTDDTFGFGLLNTDFDQLGKGIDSLLVSAAEEHARKGECYSYETGDIASLSC